MQRRIRLVVALTGGAALVVGGVWWVVGAGDDVGCDADAGPGALVAVDAASGDLRWQQRTGDQTSARLVEGPAEGKAEGKADDEVEVEAQHHTSRIAATTGEVRSCIDHDPPEPEDVAAVTASVRADGELPPLESVGGDGRWELQIAPTADGLQRVVVADRETGEVAWDVVMSGRPQIVGDLVVSTEPSGAGALVYVPAGIATGYELATGVRRWQASLPGSPGLAVGAADLIVVAINETGLAAIDRHSGDIVWQADHGSPGQGGAYSEPGYISDLLVTADSGILIATVRAAEPYRD